MSELAKQMRGDKFTKLAIPPEEGEPLTADITHGAFANLSFKKVLAEFGKTAFARSSACMEFENFLQRIGAGGKTCLEIGTYQGMSAVILSQFFDKVVCVSVDEDPRRIIKREIVEFLGLQDKIVFHDVKDNAAKAAIIRYLNFDFCYSDGDHMHDTHTDFDLVRRCGRVLFHEAWPLQPAVWNLVHTLPADEVTWASHDCFAYWRKK